MFFQCWVCTRERTRFLLDAVPAGTVPVWPEDYAQGEPHGQGIPRSGPAARSRVSLDHVAILR